MYPLHLKSAAGGFAVANDEAEHRALTELEYEPGFVSEVVDDELTSLRAEAKAAGVRAGHLMGVEKLRTALGK